MLTLATVIIAAAGYMINDYFDMSIDTINKPERVTIEKIFSRRSVIIWHIVLNLIALGDRDRGRSARFPIPRARHSPATGRSGH